jgi:hypothetical protein
MFGFGKNKKLNKTDMPYPMRKAKGHPGTFDEPKNDFERILMATRNREISTIQFIEYFVNSSAFVVVPKGQMMNSHQGMSLVVNPTIFTITYPEYTCLCFYSHESRAKHTNEHYPDYRYAVSIRVRDILMGSEDGLGIIINPYYDINMEWIPEQVLKIKQMIS